MHRQGHCWFPSLHTYIFDYFLNFPLKWNSADSKEVGFKKWNFSSFKVMQRSRLVVVLWKLSNSVPPAATNGLFCFLQPHFRMTWNLKWRRKWEFGRKLNWLPRGEGTFSIERKKERIPETQNSSIFITEVSRWILILDGAIYIFNTHTLSRNFMCQIIWNQFLSKMSLMEIKLQ